MERKAGEARLDRHDAKHVRRNDSRVFNAPPLHLFGENAVAAVKDEDEAVEGDAAAGGAVALRPLKS